MDRNDIICLNTQYSTTRNLIKSTDANQPNWPSTSGGLRKQGYTKTNLPNLPLVTVVTSTDANQPNWPSTSGGLRKQGYTKTNLPNLPLVTVVTVVRNDAENLATTIANILNQTYANVEYLIIDGASEAPTLSVLQTYDAMLDYWISEPDKGIYDAMNKGLRLARGEWIQFMNAGDQFWNNETIAQVFNFQASWANNLDHADFIYGDCMIAYEGFSRHKKALPIQKIWKGMVSPHQTFFVRTSLHRQYPFQSKTIGAEFSLFYQGYVEKKCFLQLPFTIARYRAGGVSDIRRTIVLREFWRVVKLYGVHHAWLADLYYAFLLLMCPIRQWLKQCLPKSFVQWLIQQKKH